MKNGSNLIGTNRQIGGLDVNNRDGYTFSDLNDIGVWKVVDGANAPVDGLKIEINGPDEWVTGYNHADGISATETPEEP